MAEATSILIIIGGSKDRDDDPIEEFAAIYFALRDGGARLLIASVCGGYPWSGRRNPRRPDASALAVRLQEDRQAREEIADTLSIREVFIEDFSGCVLIGSALEQKPNSDAAATLARSLLAAGGRVAVASSSIDPVHAPPVDGVTFLPGAERGLAPAITAWLAAFSKPRSRGDER